MRIQNLKIKIGKILRSINLFPIYPIIFAAVFILNLYESNYDLFPYMSHIVRPLAIVTVFALVTTAFFGVGLRNMHRGGVCASVLVYMLLFNPGALSRMEGIVGRLFNTSSLQVYLGLVIILLVILVILFVRPTANATRALNISAVAILIYHAIALVGIGTREPDLGGSLATASEVEDFADASAGGQRPDIIHIVLDGYARKDVLAESYAFDNSDFIERLADLGFAVADRAMTPYNRTLNVMNTVFYGDYLPANGADMKPLEYRDHLSNRLQRNPVTASLSKMGYTIAATRPEYPPVTMTQVDVMFNSTFNSLTIFERAVIARTVLPWAMTSFSIIQSVYSGPEIRQALSVSLQAELQSPYFAYIHILAPHTPFDIEENGDPRMGAGNGLFNAGLFPWNNPELQHVYRQGYLKKLQFINNEIYRYIARLIEESPDPKIIIVHGDHGGGIFTDQNSAANSCNKERYSPLLAVYSSDGSLQKAIPEDMNLVNLYRVVFNTYFQTDMPLRLSKSYFVEADRPARQIPIAPESLLQSCPIQSTTENTTSLLSD